MHEQFIITPSHFFKFEKDPMWIYHDAYSAPEEKEPLSEFTLKLMEDGNLHEKKYVSTIIVEEVTELDPKEGVKATLKLMEEGIPLIYQGWLEKKTDKIIYRGRPDLLKKQPGVSNFGNWIYVPVDVKSSFVPKPLHKQQLALYCLILKSVQNYRPTTASIINRDFQQVDFSIENKILTKMHNDIKSIIEILKGKKPRVFISSSAKQTPWYKKCLEEAEQLRNLSLIYKLKRKTVEALWDFGIKTIDEMAIQDIDALPKISGASDVTMRKAKIQAQSLVKKEPKFISDPVPVDVAELKLYFDIEGDPWRGIEYLLGFWVVGDIEGRYATVGHVVRSDENDGKYFLYFLAEEPEDEASMWNNFLDWLRVLPPAYKVYHYSCYEKTAVKKLSEKHEHFQVEELLRFQNSLFDLSKSVDSYVVLPIYFYSIKDIAKSPIVNFKWRHDKAGGEQSIFWYERWLETKNEQTLQDIINYNEDDVRATEHLHLWMNKSIQL